MAKYPTKTVEVPDVEKCRLLILDWKEKTNTSYSVLARHCNQKAPNLWSMLQGLRSIPEPVIVQLFELMGEPVLQEDPWRPIETAPRDGSLILIKESDGRVQVAKWCCPECHFDWYVQLTGSLTPDGYPTRNVTYWLPIPD